MKSKDVHQFGTNVRRLREKRGFSREKLAELADIHPMYVGFIERADRNITILKIIQVAKALNCNVSELFQGISTKKS